jgi:hypothetical protein
LAARSAAKVNGKINVFSRKPEAFEKFDIGLVRILEVSENP